MNHSDSPKSLTEQEFLGFISHSWSLTQASRGEGWPDGVMNSVLGLGLGVTDSIFSSRETFSFETTPSASDRGSKQESRHRESYLFLEHMTLPGKRLDKDSVRQFLHSPRIGQVKKMKNRLAMFSVSILPLARLRANVPVRLGLIICLMSRLVLQSKRKSGGSSWSLKSFKGSNWSLKAFRMTSTGKNIPISSALDSEMAHGALGSRSKD